MGKSFGAALIDEPHDFGQAVGVGQAHHDGVGPRVDREFRCVNLTDR